MKDLSKIGVILHLLSQMGLHTYFVSRSGQVKYIAFSQNTDKRIYLIAIEKTQHDGYPLGQVYFSDGRNPVKTEVWYTGYLPTSCRSGKIIRQFLTNEKRCAEKSRVFEAGSYIHDCTAYLVVFHLWLMQENFRIQEVVIR